MVGAGVSTATAGLAATGVSRTNEVSILATNAPIGKSSPSLATKMSFPLASAGNSNVALSDSNSQIGSSTLT